MQRTTNMKGHHIICSGMKRYAVLRCRTKTIEDEGRVTVVKCSMQLVYRTREQVVGVCCDNFRREACERQQLDIENIRH